MTLEERAISYVTQCEHEQKAVEEDYFRHFGERVTKYHWGAVDVVDGYTAGATDQKAIDIDKACDWLGDHGVPNIMIAALRNEMEK